jgi:hypothetical protein
MPSDHMSTVGTSRPCGGDQRPRRFYGNRFTGGRTSSANRAWHSRHTRSGRAIIALPSCFLIPLIRDAGRNSRQSLDDKELADFGWGSPCIPRELNAAQSPRAEYVSRKCRRSSSDPGDAIICATGVHTDRERELMADRRLLKGISVCGSILAVDAPAMPPPEERAKRRFPNEIDVDLSDGPRQSVHVAIDHDLNERGDGFTLTRSHFTTNLGHFSIARHQGLFRYKESKSGGAVFGCGRRARDGWRKRKGPRSGAEPFGNRVPKPRRRRELVAQMRH